MSLDDILSSALDEFDRNDDEKQQIEPQTQSESSKVTNEPLMTDQNSSHKNPSEKFQISPSVRPPHSTTEFQQFIQSLQKLHSQDTNDPAMDDAQLHNLARQLNEITIDPSSGKERPLEQQLEIFNKLLADEQLHQEPEINQQSSNSTLQQLPQTTTSAIDPALNALKTGVHSAQTESNSRNGLSLNSKFDQKGFEF